MALLGMARESADAMVTAERFLSTVDYGAAPAWVRYFTPAQMHGEFAHVAAAGGRHVDTLRFAVMPMSATGKSERRTALLATAVARAHLGVGALDEAASVASNVLDLSRGLASRRVAREVRTLCDAVATLLPTADGADLARRGRSITV